MDSELIFGLFESESVLIWQVPKCKFEYKNCTIIHNSTRIYFLHPESFNLKLILIALVINFTQSFTVLKKVLDQTEPHF